MAEHKGVIYILTNPSFPEFVKIGYADDIDRRLKELNRSECIPFAFRVYAVYEVNSRLSDLKIHSIIDKLNPNLRSIDNINGQKRVREFYAMSAEEAYSIFEAMAEIHDCSDRLKRIEATDKEEEEERTAEEISAERKERLAPFAFSLCNIPVGAELELWSNSYTNTGVICTVADDKRVEYDGKLYSLTGLVQHVLQMNYNVAGPRYFKYQGEWLNVIRQNLENR